MSAGAERAAARTETSPPVRLAKGEIPQTWSRPAEQVSQLPIRAPRPLASAFIVVGGVAAGFALALWLAPSQGAPSPAPPPPPAPLTDAVEPKPVAAIPTPPATSSTSPTNVAPEDQGGEVTPPPPPASATPAPATAPASATPSPATAPVGVAPPAPVAAPPTPASSDDSPARLKARKETDRAKALFASGEMIGAEAPLIRATLGDPTFPEAWRLLGQVRDGLGNAEGARRAYKRFLQLAPEAPEAREVRAALAALPAAAPTPPAPAAPAGN